MFTIGKEHRDRDQGTFEASPNKTRARRHQRDLRDREQRRDERVEECAPANIATSAIATAGTAPMTASESVCAHDHASSPEAKRQARNHRRGNGAAVADPQHQRHLPGAISASADRTAAASRALPITFMAPRRARITSSSSTC